MNTPKKILFISEEITPYVASSPMADFCRQLVPPIQDSGREVRTFMPKWGHINERRNQLHEVIRLSGMNIVVDDVDHQLIIKVASIIPVRMQVYFIDNDDFFRNRLALTDENGKEYEDNLERAAFYARGVLETVKKLRWVPDVIHCQGWMASLVPFLLREVYQDEPSFRDTTIIFTPSANPCASGLPTNLEGILKYRTASIKKAEKRMSASFKSYDDINRLAMSYSDGVVFLNQDDNLAQMCDKMKISHITVPAEDKFAPEYLQFFDERYSQAHPEKPVVEEDD